MNSEKALNEKAIKGYRTAFQAHPTRSSVIPKFTVHLTPIKNK